MPVTQRIVPATQKAALPFTKESVFLSAVPVAELTFSGHVIIARTFEVFEIRAIVGMLYLMLILAVLVAANRPGARLGWSHYG